MASKLTGGRDLRPTSARVLRLRNRGLDFNMAQQAEMAVGAHHLLWRRPDRIV
jgi:hypothetical protein